MKLILSIVFCYIFSYALFAGEQNFIPSRFYLIENGTAKDITHDLLSEKRSLTGLHKTTVAGYVRYPGIYYFDSSVGVIDLVDLAGHLSTKDGSVSSPILYLINESSTKPVRKYDLRAIKKALIKNPKQQPQLVGNEIIYLAGIHF